MKKQKGIISLLTLLVLSAMLLCSCGETAGTADTSAPAAEATETVLPESTEPVETKLQANIPNTKYNCDFVIASGYVTETKYTTNAIVSDEVNGDQINDAIYKRTEKLSNDLGVNVIVMDVNYNQINTDFNTGNRSYDIGTATLSEIMTVVNNGTTVNLKNVQSIDLDMPWWDTNANNKFRIGENLYYTLSDFFITGIDNSRCVYFNKELATDLGLGNLYDLADQGKWTIEKMSEFSKKALRDLNGDGSIDNSDMVGIANNATTFYEVMLTGCDAELVKQSDNGIPYFCPFDETDFFIEVYTKLLDLFGKDNHYLITSAAKARTMFQSGNALFIADTMQLCSKMRQEAEIEFGIMPVPKYSEDQQNYLQVSPNADVFFIIGGQTADIERAGVILEAASYWSSSYYSDDALMPSYFQLALVSKSATDVESAANLQLIHDNISYVIKIAGTSFSGGVYAQFEAGNPNISSYISSQKKSNQKILRTALEKFGLSE